MLEFLPKDIADGLAMARNREAARKSRLRVQVGEAVFHCCASGTMALPWMPR